MLQVLLTSSVKCATSVQQWRLVWMDNLRPLAQLQPDGSVRALFYYGDRPNVPEAMEKEGTLYRIVSDHLGSMRLVLNANTGTITQQMDYDMWGQITQDSNPGFQPFGYAGGLYDSDTRLTRFGARDYDAETGRWTAKDPILFEGGDSNLFAYVEGNPISFTDPDGLRSNAGGSARQRRQDRREQAREAQAEAIRVQNYLQRKAEQDAWMRNFTRRNEEWDQYGDGFGTLTGGGIAGRHPSFPNSLETLLDPRREGPYVPDLRGNTCPAIIQGR